MREEIAQEVTELGRKAVVEAGSSDRLVRCCLIGALEASNRAVFAVHGEAQDERPHEHRDVDFSVTLDGIARARDTFDNLLGKERS